jgi:alpha-ketoglutarate-dependent taurine dioxygenase
MRCIEAPTGSGHWLSCGDNDDRLWCEAGSTAFASGRVAFALLSDALQQACLRSRVHYSSHPFQACYGLGNSASGLRLVDDVAEARYLQGEDIPGKPIDDPLAQVYPLVWTCPITGEQALMAQPRCMHALQRTGAHFDDAQFLGVVASRHEVEALMRPAIAPRQVYVHPWQPGDLVIWNNRSMWHSATGKLSRDDRRIMHLTAFNATQPPVCNPA